VPQKAFGAHELTGVRPEMLLQRRERTVVPDGDRTQRPRHGTEMPGQEPWPPVGRQPAEDEDAQVGEVRPDDQIGESRRDGVHDDDGTSRTS